MENIDAGIIGHSLMHILKGSQKKLIELVTGLMVIFDLASFALVVDVIGWVSKNQVNLRFTEQLLVGFCFSRITAK